MDRRIFLASLLSASAVGVNSIEARAQQINSDPSLHLSVGDAPGGPQRSEQITRERFKTCRDLGFGMLRAELGRVDIIGAKLTRENEQSIRYLQTAVASGLSLKLPVGGMSLLAASYFKDHPDALVRNKEEETVEGYLSPWYPGIHDLLIKTTETTLAFLQQANLLPHISSFIADLGPASEPIFPADWEVKGKTAGKSHGYWFYDLHAQKAFSRDMQTQFAGNLPKLNLRWNAAFKSWSDVRTPKLGEHAGAMWLDTLTWYRDTKRRLIFSQTQQIKSIISSFYKESMPTLTLLVPGNHLEDDKLSITASKAGVADGTVYVMTDTDFIVNTAMLLSCDVQYTASQNDNEIKYIKSLLLGKKTATAVWAENAGGSASLNPDHLVDVVIDNNLAGFEYINAGSLFVPDSSAPSLFLPKVAKALQRLQQYYHR